MSIPIAMNATPLGREGACLWRYLNYVIIDRSHVYVENMAAHYQQGDSGWSELEARREIYFTVSFVDFAWSSFRLVLVTGTAAMEDEERQKKLEAGKAKVGFSAFWC